MPAWMILEKFSKQMFFTNSSQIKTTFGSNRIPCMKSKDKKLNSMKSMSSWTRYLKSQTAIAWLSLRSPRLVTAACCWMKTISKANMKKVRCIAQRYFKLWNKWWDMLISTFQKHLFSLFSWLSSYFWCWTRSLTFKNLYFWVS